MSKWSRKKNLTFDFAFFAFFIVVVSVSSFFIFYEKANCFDGIQNQAELGVDCGGVCEKICALAEKPLVIEWTRVFKLDKDAYSAIAYVRNPNISVGAKNLPFEFNFFDNKGVKIKSATSFVDINNSGYTPIFIPFVAAGNVEIYQAGLRFLEEPRWENLDSPKFELKSVEIKNVSTPKVKVRVLNKGETIIATDFVAILYTKDNNAIAASTTYIDKLERGEEKLLIYTWVNGFDTDEVICGGRIELCRGDLSLEILPVKIFLK